MQVIGHERYVCVFHEREFYDQMRGWLKFADCLQRAGLESERDVLSFGEKTAKNEKLYCKRTLMFSEIHRGFIVRRKGVLQMVQSVQKIRSNSKRREKELKKKFLVYCELAKYIKVALTRYRMYVLDRFNTHLSQ